MLNRVCVHRLDALAIHSQDNAVRHIRVFAVGDGFCIKCVCAFVLHQVRLRVQPAAPSIVPRSCT